MLLYEKSEIHSRYLHIRGFLNDKKVDIQTVKVDIRKEKVDIKNALMEKGLNLFVKQ